MATQSNSSYLGAQLNATAQNLDVEIPGIVQDQVQKTYWNPKSMSQNPMCGLAANEQCNSSSSVNFWSYGKSRISPQENSVYPIMGCGTASSSHYSQETVENKACGPSCCGRASPENFWQVGSSSQLLDGYSRSHIDYCMNFSQGDDESLRRCLGQQ